MTVYGELIDLLPKHLQRAGFDYPVKKSRSVKDLIEALGIPHTEVNIILVDAVSVDFRRLIHGGEKLLVYPAGFTPAADTLIHNVLIHNQPPVPPVPRFLLDVHLGRLASYLRLLGYDTRYRNDFDDQQLAELSASEQRILVTCDRKLLMRRQVVSGYLMRARQPEQQIIELLSRFDLRPPYSGMVRCLDCNGLIQRVEKKAIESRLLPLTRQHYDEFFQCGQCHKIYWKGSHYDNLQKLLQKFSRALNAS